MTRGGASRLLLLVPVTAIAVALIATAGPSELWRYPIDYLLDAGTGIALVAAGLIAWDRRPAWRSGPLLVVAGYLWYVGSLHELLPEDSLAPYLGFAFRGYYDVILAFVVLAVPVDRLVRRREVAIVVALLAGMLVRSGWRLVATPPGVGTGHAPTAPASPLLLVRDVDLLISVDSIVSAWIGVALWLVAAEALWRLFRDRRPGSTRLTDPVLLGGALWAALAGTYAVAGFLERQTGIVVLPDGGAGRLIEWLPRLAGPIGLLLGMSRLRASSSAAVALLAAGGAPPRGVELERALRSALADPTVRVLYPSDAGWVDHAGAPEVVPAAGSGRAATIIDAGDRPVCAIVHDEGLLDDPVVMRTIGAVVGLAVDNARLSDDLRAQLEEVRASRARIVEAADAERRRVERDLHDGAQQRLLAVTLSLRTIRSRLGPDVPESVATELDAAAEEVRAANAELRELAQGLDPAILREAGLDAAIRSLADRSPVPVEVTMDLETRLPSGVETAAYFVTAEALANVAKHAHASGVQLRAAASDGWLRVDIADDGVGGADVNGAGLRGLVDRVAAVGGTFAVTTPPSGGTRIEVAIPCGS